MNLNQIINWEKSKGVFHWVSVTFDELKNTRKRKYEYSNRSGKDNITDNDEQVETKHETSKSINETELEIQKKEEKKYKNKKKTTHKKNL